MHDVILIFAFFVIALAVAAIGSLSSILAQDDRDGRYTRAGLIRTDKNHLP